MCSSSVPPTEKGGIYPKHQPHGDEAVQARVIQLEALLKGEVGTGEDLAQRKLQHSQSALQVIIQHLGSGPVTNQGRAEPTMLPLHLVLGSLCLFQEVYTMEQLTSGAIQQVGLATSQTLYLPGV